MGRADDEVVLITGYPGLMARKLTAHVLEHERETRVVVLVLPDRIDQAVAALASLDPKAHRRVEILEGDVAAMDLGLSGVEYRELAARVTRIHHTAQVSYVGVEREKAEYTNIQGAVEMVELGTAAERLSCIVHHSTAYVSGDRTGTVYEDELDKGQGFHGVVQESRMKAELVMRRAIDRLPIAVVRPTMLVGDSITGETERFDGPYLLVMLILGLPGDMAVPLPHADAPLDIVPVDYVVRAAHAIGRHETAPGRTFHLTSSEALSAQQVFDLIAQAGGRRTAKGYIPAQLASALMRTPGLERVLREPRAFLRQLSSPAQYDTRNTRRILADTDITCPPLETYVDTWVLAVQRHLRERRNGDDGARAPEIDDPLL
jgi:thioester reductase-like protein